MPDNGTNPEKDRLPPPAFPPGSGHRPSSSGSDPDRRSPAAGGSIPDDAIFSPDDPIVRSGTRVPDDAFFSPDDPVVRATPPTTPEDFEQVVGALKTIKAVEVDDDQDDGDEGVVTGMSMESGARAHTAPGTRGHRERRFDDPHVEHLYARLVGLAKSVRDRGEAGLRTTPEMSRFEATLRGYCVGYLAGLREDRDPHD